MLKKFFVSLLLFLIIFYTNICYATSVKVTNDNLNTALQTTFQKFSDAYAENIKYTVKVTDNNINISDGKEDFNLKYDLTNNPTFNMEVPIKSGMSYSEFEKQTSYLITFPMLAYIAVANIQGVDFDDATMYFMSTYLANALSKTNSISMEYTIYDDTKLSEGVTVEKNDNDSKTILASEFGNRVMEYVNYLYKDKSIMKDLDVNSNTWSYELTTERKDVTESSCKLVSSMVVNLDMDFSKLKGYKENIGESIKNQIEKEEEKLSQNEDLSNVKLNENSDVKSDETNYKKDTSDNINKNSNSVNSDSTVAQNKIVNAGESKKIILTSILFICVIVLMIFGTKNLKYKDVK